MCLSEAGHPVAMVLEERRVPGRGRTVRDSAGGYDTQVSYSRWESCGLQQGSKISAPGSASAGGGQTVPGGALAQGSLRATEGGFSLRVDSLALSIRPTHNSECPATGAWTW